MPRRAIRRRRHIGGFWEDLQSKAKKAGETIRDTAGNVSKLSAEFKAAESYADGLASDIKDRGFEACRKAYSDATSIHARIAAADGAMNVIGRKVPALSEARKRAVSAAHRADDAFESTCIISGKIARKSR